MTTLPSIAVLDREPAAPEPAASPASPGPVPGRSLRVENLRKEYHTPLGVRRVLDGISFEVRRGERIAVLGRNGSGKSTLVKLIGGVEQPTSGTIRRGLSLSWPLGFVGGVSSFMTGAACARFVARLYSRDERQVLDFVDDFAELGRQLYLPMETYSTGMRSRLMFALTFACDFECLLIDEVLAVGDPRFHAKCHEMMFGRNHAMVLVSHAPEVIKEFCKSALVLKAGRGRVFEDLELALKIYATL